MIHWLVPVTRQQVEQLREDYRDLGKLTKSNQGELFLVFRDRFVALKVAASIGASPPYARPSTSTQMPSKEVLSSALHS